MDLDSELYLPEFTDLLNAEAGSVFLSNKPRVCIRGPEDRSASDLGYPFLASDDVFPFYELRSAADDLRDGSEFDPSSMRRKIAAQLDTVSERGLRHVVLSAFGCGAFGNPAESVARIYKEEIATRQANFDGIVFAIFHAGYGPDNYSPFAKVFADI